MYDTLFVRYHRFFEDLHFLLVDKTSECMSNISHVRYYGSIYLTVFLNVTLNLFLLFHKKKTPHQNP